MTSLNERNLKIVDQREEADREAERGDRDLLADRVGGDRRAGRHAGEDLDQERLLHARAAGRERDDRGDRVDAEDEQHVLTEPPMWNASSRNQKAAKRKHQPPNWTSQTSRK